MIQRGFQALLLALLLGCGSGGEAGPGDDPTGPEPVDTVPPTGLALPVATDNLVVGAMVNPFGVVRSSLDMAGLGHPGIDLVSQTGAPIFAVGSGVIVSVEPQPDGLPGNMVRLFLGTNTTAGEGWVFFYEHIALRSGLGVGSTVARGEQIATNPLGPGISNHLEMSWAFNNFRFHRDQRCWIEHLESGQRAVLQTFFDTVLRVHPDFIGAWQTVDFEGMAPFRELLNPARFPNGPQLCYPPGTDVRVPY